MGLRPLCLVIIALLASSTALGFVQNVTHGYPACIACHVSPNGGGLLTDYGRSLSKELMSTWGVSDNFAQPFFGAVKNRENVKFGGDLRTLQFYRKDKTTNTGELFPMQQNVEVGVQVSDKVMLVATAGLQQGPPQRAQRIGQFISERHYALWSPAPTSRVRIGKFRQTFGINTDNHTRFIKQTFGFGSLSETYNLEFTQFYESYEVTLGSSLGRIDNPRTPRTEQNLSAHYTYYLNENSRVGGSLLVGESPLKRRTLSSVNAVLPLSKNWMLLSELDYERSHLSASPQDAIETVASFVKVGHTLFKGFMWYPLFEHFSVESVGGYTMNHQPGVGIQWWPVPHLNVQVEYLREVKNASYDNPEETGWVQFHVYL